MPKCAKLCVCTDMLLHTGTEQRAPHLGTDKTKKNGKKGKQTGECGEKNEKFFFFCSL